MACDDANTSLAALISALGGPRRVVTDGMEVEQYSLDDIIKAHRYLASVCASNKSHRGLRFTKIVPEGTVNLGDGIGRTSDTDDFHHII